MHNHCRNQSVCHDRCALDNIVSEVLIKTYRCRVFRKYHQTQSIITMFYCLFPGNSHELLSDTATTIFRSYRDTADVPAIRFFKVLIGSKYIGAINGSNHDDYVNKIIKVTLRRTGLYNLA